MRSVWPRSTIGGDEADVRRGDAIAVKSSIGLYVSKRKGERHDEDAPPHLFGCEPRVQKVKTESQKLH
jgi:hypothetical protein